jgi:DNA-binding XRE family transcriptional regulator
MGGIGQGPRPDPGTARSLRRLLQFCRRRRHLEEAWPVAADFAAEHGYWVPPVQTLWTRRQARQRERGVPAETGLTQAQTASLVGRSLRTYVAWEQGTKAVPEEQVPLVAAVLGMTGDQLTLLYRLRFRRDPPPTLAEPDVELVHPAWRAFLGDQPYPAYAADYAWNRLVENRSFYDFFPWVAPDAPAPERNILRMLLRPEAVERMVDWETRWAVPLLRRVWGAYQMHPDNRHLGALVAEIAGNPRWRHLWRRREAPELPRLDTDIRTYIHPRRGPLQVALLVSEPDSLAAAGYRIVCLRPLTGRPPTG